MELNQLYQEIIVDHNNNPRNYYDMSDPDRWAQGYNPLCGDQIQLYLKLKDESIVEASFYGCGCAISTASASLMTEALIGCSVAEARKLFQQFHQAVTKADVRITFPLGKLEVLLGVKAFPARVKCATLAWHTLLAALENLTTPVSTE